MGNRGFKIEEDLEQRRGFRGDPLLNSELTEPRRRYVVNFFRMLGYDAADLDDEKTSAVFSLLARLEEYGSPLRHNGHNWDLDYASLARQRQRTIPVVETWARQWATEGVLTPIRDVPPRWPDGKRFALCLTHDMDILGGNTFRPRMRSLRTLSGTTFQQKAIALLGVCREAARGMVPGRSGSDPLLAEWMREESQHGFKSSFFFLAQPIPCPDWEDSFYRYKDRVRFDDQRLPIGEVMRIMAHDGWDVGLHGSSRSHASAELLAKERAIVSDACGMEAVTIRQHHLFCDVRYTPSYQNRAGFLADSTLGSNLRACFRCGTGMPFYWYDAISDRQLDILESPLIIQDVALFRILQMDVDTAIRHCVEIMEVVADLGGAMTVLWHNNYHASAPEFKTYQLLLQEAARLGAWGCSLRQLMKWWRQRYEQCIKT